jgi:hypothetical protein
MQWSSLAARICFYVTERRTSVLTPVCGHLRILTPRLWRKLHGAYHAEMKRTLGLFLTSHFFWLLFALCPLSWLLWFFEADTTLKCKKGLVIYPVEEKSLWICNDQGFTFCNIERNSKMKLFPQLGCSPCSWGNLNLKLHYSISRSQVGDASACKQSHLPFVLARFRGW